MAAMLMLLLLLSLPAAANFYIVVSQVTSPREDVVTVAVVLDMNAHVGRDQHLCCLLSHRGISTYVLLFCLMLELFPFMCS